MDTNYYSNMDFKYNEIAELLESITIPASYSGATIKGKFYIPALFPLLPKTTNTATIGKHPINKIMNDSTKLNINSCVVGSYIELDIPVYMCVTHDRYTYSLTESHSGEVDNYSMVKTPVDTIVSSGTKYIITFVGGDINKIRIIGVY